MKNLIMLFTVLICVSIVGCITPTGVAVAYPYPPGVVVYYDTIGTPYYYDNWGHIVYVNPRLVAPREHGPRDVGPRPYIRNAPNPVRPPVTTHIEPR